MQASNESVSDQLVSDKSVSNQLVSDEPVSDQPVSTTINELRLVTTTVIKKHSQQDLIDLYDSLTTTVARQDLLLRLPALILRVKPSKKMVYWLIKNLPKDKCMFVLPFIRTENQCIAFVKHFGRYKALLSHIKKKKIAITDKLALAIVKKDPDYIAEITNPSEDVQLVAVKKEPMVIQYIVNPSEKVQLAAVSNEPHAIQWINNPSEKVQLEAVSNDAGVMRHIQNPSEEVQLEAVTKIPKTIRHILSPSEEVQTAAVLREPATIRYIHNPSKNVQMCAVGFDPRVIAHIEHPDEDVAICAIEEDPLVINRISHTTEKMYLVCAAKNPYAIDKVDDDDITPRVEVFASLMRLRGPITWKDTLRNQPYIKELKGYFYARPGGAFYDSLKSSWDHQTNTLPLESLDFGLKDASE